MKFVNNKDGALSKVAGIVFNVPAIVLPAPLPTLVTHVMKGIGAITNVNVKSVMMVSIIVPLAITTPVLANLVPVQ